MSSIVSDLQLEALDRNVPVSDLLRKALVVARKLKLSELQSWIEKELNGYRKTDEVPDYREIYGQVRAWNPFHGWIPVIIEDSPTAKLLSRRKTSQSVAELEHLIKREKEDLHMPVQEEFQRHLRQACRAEAEFALIVPGAAIAAIIDTVRTIILNWALKLEGRRHRW